MNPQQQFATVGGGFGRTGSAAFSGLGQFATAARTASAGGGGAPGPLGSWSPPSAAELQYYDALFALADEDKRQAIGGRVAVAFFSRSKLDKSLLREIWSIADSQQRSELSRNEFFVALRLISMAQRGEAVTIQRFYDLAQAPFPPPVLDGVPPAPPLAATAQPSQPAVAPPPPPSALQHGGAFAITEEEKARYDGIFQQYDADRDGFLHGGEAVQLFGMSGLDRSILRDIWSMADRSQDSKLDVKEFYVAMHLIVCVSKRGLPLPTELPKELSDGVFGQPPTNPSMTSTLPPSSDSRSSSFAMGGMPSFSAAPAPSAGDSRTSSMSALGPMASTSRQPDDSRNKMDAFAALSLSAGECSAPAIGTTTTSNDGIMAPLADPTVTAPMTPNTRPSFGLPGVTPSLLAHPELTRDRTSSIGSTSSIGPSTESPGFPPAAPSSAAAHPHSTQGSVSGQTGGFAVVGMARPSVGSFHSMAMPAAPAAQAPSATVSKPFMGSDDEGNALRQLEQHNDEVLRAFLDVEKKQNAIEVLSEKLRELDQLRSELVTLTMKRTTMQASTNAASTSARDGTAEVEARRAVERSLQTLVDGEKEMIQALQSEIATIENEIDDEVSAARGPAPASSLSAGPNLEAVAPTPKMAAPINTNLLVGGAGSGSSSNTPKTAFEAFGDFGSSSPAAPPPTSGAPAGGGL